MPKGCCLSGPGLEAREEEEKKQFREEEKAGTLHAYVAAAKESVQTCPTSQHTHTPRETFMQGKLTWFCSTGAGILRAGWAKGPRCCYSAIANMAKGQGRMGYCILETFLNKCSL